MPCSVWLVLFLGLIHVNPNKAASIRLVNGSSSCSGRVEILYSGQWGALCEDGWNKEDGEVVCREMGCGMLIEEKKDSFFGEGSLPILMNKVKCVNTESSLMDCEAVKGLITCDKKGAGVMCMPNVRVMDGLNSCSGQVEVYKDDQWGSVCDDAWDLSDAAVVCRELGCGNVTEVKKGSYFGRGSGGPIKIHGLNCDGSESTLSSCVSDNGAVDPSVCDISKTAGVVCQSLIRLENGDGLCSGRVEVYHDGQWGTVCDGGWDSNDGNVVCKEVGCGGLIEEKKDAFFGQGSGPIWVKDLDCVNTESTVRNCKVKSWGGTDCLHDKDAGVVCELQQWVMPPSVGTENTLTGMIYKYHLRIEVTGDPNDPAIRDIVLRKIEVKLPTDANITLGWKTQPTGNIFELKKT